MVGLCTNKTHLDQVWIHDKPAVDRTIIIIIILVVLHYFHFADIAPFKLVEWWRLNVNYTVVQNSFVYDIALGKSLIRETIVFW